MLRRGRRPVSGTVNAMTTLTPAPTGTSTIAAPRRRTLVGLTTAFLVCFAALMALGGSDLEADAPLADIEAAYDYSETFMQWASYSMMAVCALLVFAGLAIRAALRVRGATWTADAVALGTLVLALTVAGWAMSGAALWRAVDQGEDASVRTLNFVDTTNFLPLMIGMVCVYVGAGLAGLANGSLPRPLAVVSVLLGVAAPLGPVGFVTVGLLPIWFIVVSALVRLDGEPLAAS